MTAYMRSRESAERGPQQSHDRPKPHHNHTDASPPAASALHLHRPTAPSHLFLSPPVSFYLVSSRPLRGTKRKVDNAPSHVSPFQEKAPESRALLIGYHNHAALVFVSTIGQPLNCIQHDRLLKKPHNGRSVSSPLQAQPPRMLASSLLYGLLAAASAVDAHRHAKAVDFTVITGILQQDDNSTDPSAFNFTASNFGLIERAYPSDASLPHGKNLTQWQRLAHYMSMLNRKCKRNERYSLLFMGRHGEGVHNAAESYFGTPAWNCYWSELDGNATATWADAKLTAAGKQQARVVNAFWKHLIKDEGITLPETFYTSPLYRCLDTARLTFEGINLANKKPVVPVIKELLREGISAHTCDRRHNKTYIHQNFPTFEFEKGFAEEDPYWTALKSEPQASQDARSKAVLDDIFTNDHSTYISITSHSGEIGSLLRGKFQR